MKIVIFLLLSFLEIIGFAFLDGISFILYTFFCCLTASFDWYFVKQKALEGNLISIFLFTSWLLYNALGFIHYDIVVEKKGMIHTIYVLFIICTILLFLPFYMLRNRKYRRLYIVSMISPNRKVMIILLCIQLALVAFKIHIAGGLYNYIFSSYGEKTEGVLMTFFHLFESIMRYVGVFLYPFLFIEKTNKIFKTIIVLHVIYTISYGAISGSSLSILSPLLVLFTFSYFATKHQRTRRIIKKALLVSVVGGVIGGMLIRVNRHDNSSFQAYELKTAFSEIMESPTFDNIVNLETVIKNLEPTYLPNELIYPFVHFLPRRVFSWKPEELGTIVGYEFVGVDKDAKVGFIASPLGDFYYDFGYVGMLFGMLFVGCFFAIIQRKLNSNMKDNNRLFVLSCMLIISGITITLPGWYTGCFNGVVNAFIFVLGLLFLQSIFGKNRVIKKGGCSI